MDVYEKIKNLHPEFAGLTGYNGGIWSKKEPDYDVYKKIGRLHPVFLINFGCKGTKKLYTSKFPLETG